MAAVTASSIRSALPSTCTVSTPGGDDTVYSFLSKRWMTMGSSTLPAAAIVPSTEKDVVAVVQYAAANGLKILPQCGACGGLVITNNKTIYLDMEKFRSVDVNAEARTVTFGGGTLTKDFQPAVAEKGFYTGWPNLGVVGMVGNILGGGINLFQATKGHTCDHLVSARLVTGTGDVVEVSETSTGSKKELFYQLKGAGAGFGVILSMTMRIYPTAELSLADNSKIPEVMAMFSRDNFGAATKLWEKASRAKGPLNTAFILMAAPPTMPNAGQPIVFAQASYPGPQVDADKAFEPWNDPAIKEKAIMVKPGSSDLTRMNAQRDATMKQGSNMDCYNGLIRELSSTAFLLTASRFAKFVDTYGSNVSRCMTVLHPMHSDALMKASEGQESWMCHRDRSFMVQTVPWNLADEYIEAGRQYGRDILEIVRTEDSAKGVPNAILAGNARIEADMTEIITSEKIEIMRKRKQQWDPRGIFWNPAVDGWAY
ncbi:FAD-binding domain-containing protein [Xylariaceae sp. AK1471]|nr:FAD-binding domain-containing protein [Xylariaceae sp. AK1471]